MIIKVKVSKK